MKDKYTHEEFVRMAILKLRNVSKSRGIHTVYSGFNEAFRQHFGVDPIKVTQELASKGIIEIKPAKRGVMIYLAGDSPVKSDTGKEALAKIFGSAEEVSTGLLEKVKGEVFTKGIKKFPEDFIIQPTGGLDTLMLDVPGTQLHIDLNSQTCVTSPKRHFRYEAKNPTVAKYIVYANNVGQNKIKIPKDIRVVFKAVTDYEKYCQEMREKCFSCILEHTHDEETAEHLSKELGQKIGLRA